MFVDGSYNAAYRHHSFQFDLNTENCSLLNALKKSLHLSRRKTCFAHPVLENFFFVYRGVSFETANRSSIPSNSFMRDNSNIPLPIAVLQQFLGLFSMRSTRLKIVFMFMPDILKYTPFRFFESHTYHGRKKGAAPIGAAPCSLSKKSSNGWAFLRLYDKMVLGDERCWNAEKWIVVS